MFRSNKSIQIILSTNIAFCCALLVLCFWSSTTQSSNRSITDTPSLVVAPLSNEPIQPIPEFNNFDLKKIALGKKLFHDKNLSKDKNRSCADCHDLKLGGADQKIRSVMASGVLDDVNTPTIFNVSLNTQYYWSGKFTSLSLQLDDALNELDTNWRAVMQQLATDDNYRQLFESVFPTGLNRENVKDAIITFERSLTTPNSPFDSYLNGDRNAISATAIRGYRLFKSYGCITCHQGVNVGGNFISNVDDTPFGSRVKHQIGGKTTKLRKPLRKIRVPSLRNVELTGPYFHDGSVSNLNSAVAIMGQRYTGLRLPKHDERSIVHFLKALTGKLNGHTL